MQAFVYARRAEDEEEAARSSRGSSPKRPRQTAPSTSERMFKKWLSVAFESKRDDIRADLEKERKGEHWMWYVCPTTKVGDLDKKYKIAFEEDEMREVLNLPVPKDYNLKNLLAEWSVRATEALAKPKEYYTNKLDRGRRDYFRKEWGEAGRGMDISPERVIGYFPRELFGEPTLYQENMTPAEREIAVNKWVYSAADPKGTLTGFSLNWKTDAIQEWVDTTGGLETYKALLRAAGDADPHGHVAMRYFATTTTKEGAKTKPHAKLTKTVISGEGLWPLMPNGLLQSEGINFYAALIRAKNTSTTCLIVPANFYGHFIECLDYNDDNSEIAYGKVKRQFKKYFPKSKEGADEMDSLFRNAEKLVLPVYVPGHWVCAVIDFTTKAINVLDSLYNVDRHRTVGTQLIRFLKEDAADCKGPDFDERGWKDALETCIGDTTRDKLQPQGNVRDCGIYCCWATRKMALPDEGAPRLDALTPKNVDYMRKIILNEVLSKKLAAP